MSGQELLVLAAVALAAGYWLLRIYRTSLAGPLAKWLLKRGQVKLAMRVRGQSRVPGCDDCH